MYERFFGSIGILSGGIFGKVIHDYIYSNRSYSQIDGQTYYVTEPRNLSNPATLFGIEFALNRRLEELPGLLHGLGIEVNGAWIHSEAEVPCYIGTKEEFVKTSLPNQSSLLFNAILYYELNGLTVKLAGNFRGRSLETINSSVSPDLWIWTADHFSLDLAGSYAITNRIRLFCELQNLTDAPVRMYLGDPRRTKDIEWSSRRGQAGLRFTIF
jgi:TonB-dependent receptor